MHPVNKLPLELLARIFVTGEDIHRGVRLKSGQPYVGLQDSVVQVCRKWRDVAIRTPTLWTYLYISKLPPHRHAELYISRSGVCPLVIDLSLKRSYIKSLGPSHGQEHAERVGETLNFLVKSGATLDRWGGLIVCSKLPQAMIHIIRFANSGPMTALRFLSLKWKPDSVIEMFELLESHGHILEEAAMSLQMPQLRHVEFDGLPNPYVFNLVLPMLSNLTFLKFARSMILPSIQEFSVLLSASPRLESLFIDIGGDYHLGDKADNLALLELPLLRILSLKITTVPVWGLQLLQVINAPNLESFELVGSCLGLEQTVLQELFRYLGTGQVNEDFQFILPPKKGSTRCGLIFPSLRCLNIGTFECPLPIIQALSDAFPTVVQVTLELTALVVLSESPHLLPNASHFTFNNAQAHSFKFILRFVSCRAKAGMRVSTLKITTDIQGLASETSNGEDSDLHKKCVAPLHQFVDKIIVRLHEPDSKPSRLSYKCPFNFWGTDSEEDE